MEPTVDSGKAKLAPGQDDVAFDPVEEGSQESFPASDAPSWTVSTGEKGSSIEQRSPGAKPSEDKRPADNPETRGCATSFLMDERGEIGGVCGDLQPDPKEEYVQPDKEREAGGEG